jgi:DNA replication protein DnaC
MLDKTKQILREFRCYHSANELESIIEQAKSDDLSYLDFLCELFKNELINRQKNRRKRYEKMANFPTIKTIEEFDFRFQTSITKKEVNEWLTFTWIDKRENKILMGPPGVGKTHLTLGIGFSAVYNGYRVIFYSMQTLIEEMIIAEKEGAFNDFIKKILKFDLIIIDELGYLPLKPVYANLFFQLINHCYEHRSVLITSNKLCSEWGNCFGDQTIVAAILDRLLHHAETILLNGDSYRQKYSDFKKI